MKLVSYGPVESERAGILIDDEIVDLAKALEACRVDLVCPTIRTFLERPDWFDLLQEVLEHESGDRVELGEVRLGAPIPRPGNVFVVGANTFSHVREAAEHTRGLPPQQPMILAKATSSLTGPFDPIAFPAATRKLDYEVELGVVIGGVTRRIGEEDALEAVAGYLVVNDLSARDVQLAEAEDNTFYRTHYLGKSFDGFCPAGPWLVTRDEIPDPGTLSLRTWVNDDLRQDGSTADLCFGVAGLVSYLSSVVTLLPGDLILTGSPAGVAAFREDEAYLFPGDLVRCEVGRVGCIENRITSEGVTNYPLQSTRTNNPRCD